MTKKEIILGLLKIAGAGAAGAVVSNADAITTVLPPKWQPYAGAAVTLAALFMQRPGKTPPSPPPSKG